MAFIYSTLTSDQYYCSYKKPQTAGNVSTPIQDKGVLISGQANVTNKNFITPESMMTEVTSSELEFLKCCGAFNRHVERGYIKIESKRLDSSDVAKTMAKKDKSAPLSKKDFDDEVNGIKIKVKTN